MEEESQGVQAGRIQGGKGSVSHAKEFVHYPAGHGEPLKGFKCGIF